MGNQRNCRCLRNVCSLTNPSYDLIHSVMNKLFSKLSQNVRLGVFKRGFHRSRSCPAFPPLRSLSYKLTDCVDIAFLSDYAARAQVADQQFEKIRLGRVLDARVFVDPAQQPNVASVGHTVVTWDPYLIDRTPNPAARLHMAPIPLPKVRTFRSYSGLFWLCIECRQCRRRSEITADALARRQATRS
jgi:hypothetical protein